MVQSTDCSQIAKNSPVTHTQNRGTPVMKGNEACKGKDLQKEEISPKTEMPLQNILTTLQAKEERRVTAGLMLEQSTIAQSAPCITTVIKKR